MLEMGSHWNVTDRCNGMGAVSAWQSLHGCHLGLLGFRVTSETALKLLAPWMWFEVPMPEAAPGEQK